MKIRGCRSQWLKVVVILGLSFALLFCATPAYADTNDPDSTPTVEDINIYRNSIESGDWVVIIYANIPYSAIPDTPVTDTFIWRLIDTDNVTELGSTIGFDFNDDGYGYNVYSMYFSASTVTTLGLVWGTSYPIRLLGNPAVFDSPPIYNFTVNAVDYSSETTRAAVQSEIASRVITIASDLFNKWGLSANTSLLTQNESATVLSTNGESFFRGAIHGLQAMAPGAFSVVIRVIDIEYRTWTDNYSGNLTSQGTGTWVETSQAAGDALFGTDYNFLSLLMLLVMCGALMYGNVTLTGDAWNGLIDCSVLGIIGARLGMFDLGFLMLMAALCIFYISAKIWFGLIK